MLLNLLHLNLSILQVTILTFIHQDHMLQMLVQCLEVKKMHSCQIGKFVPGFCLPYVIRFDCIS